jgi:hypothetical protein
MTKETAAVSLRAAAPKSSCCHWKRRPSLCHSERSRGICGFSGLILEMFPTEPVVSWRSPIWTSVTRLSRFFALAHAAALRCAGRLGLSLLCALSTKRNLFLARSFSGNFLAAILTCWFLPAASLFMFALAWNGLIPRPTTRRLRVGLSALFCSHTTLRCEHTLAVRSAFVLIENQRSLTSLHAREEYFRRLTTAPGSEHAEESPQYLLWGRTPSRSCLCNSAPRACGRC